ncbi:MAG TPA: hypothetical protein VNX68_09365 [Nitrosopumilaceae archaeon]|jgi:hypothetical protein|nr:hypothetical protein [Nitrosopumilaceae archaeon]
MAGFNDFLFGTPERTQQFQRFTPQQQGFQNQSTMGAQNLLNRLLSPQGGFSPIAQEARNQFQTETVPGLAERFTAFRGGQGGQRSSAFQGALGSAGAGLERGLAADSSRFNQNLLSMLSGISQQSSFENLFRPREAGFLENSANKFVDYLPSIIGALFGVPVPPMGGGQQQQQGNSLFALSGGVGGNYNPGASIGSLGGFQSPNFAQQFGNMRF